MAQEVLRFLERPQIPSHLNWKSPGRWSGKQLCNARRRCIDWGLRSARPHPPILKSCGRKSVHKGHTDYIDFPRWRSLKNPFVPSLSPLYPFFYYYTRIISLARADLFVQNSLFIVFRTCYKKGGKEDHQPREKSLELMGAGRN
jgi:hypothetical protein